jgi:hypothetical protein
MRLAELTPIANDRVAKTPGTDLGPLSVVTARYPNEAYGWPQIRSQPLKRLSGGEFRYLVGSWTPGVPLSCIVDDGISRAASVIAEKQEQAAQLVEAARRIVEQAIDRAPRGFSPAMLHAIGVTISHANELGLIVELKTLGDDLSLGIDRIVADTLEKLDRKAEELNAAHNQRVHLLASLTTNRSRAIVEEPAWRIMTDAGLGLEFVCDYLERHTRLSFTFEADRKFGMLSWSEGCLTGGFEDAQAGVNLSQYGLDVEVELPATIVTALPGRRLGEVFDDLHPYLPVDAVIKDAFEWPTGTRLIVAWPTRTIPLASDDG